MPRATPPLPIAVTMGEPAGIGPDLLIAIWTKRRELKPPLFYCIGDPRLFASRARLLGLECPIAEVDPARAAGVLDRALPVSPLVTRTPVTPGTPEARHAPTVGDAIRRAVDDVRAGLAAALVTNPIHKGHDDRRRIRLCWPYRVPGRAGRVMGRQAGPAGDDARRSATPDGARHGAYPARRGADGAVRRR